MVWWWWIIPGFVAVIGLAFVLSGLGWLFRGRPFKGGRGVLGGALFLGVGAVLGLIGLNIQTYHRLAEARQCVATLHFTGVGVPNTYRLVVTEPVSPLADCNNVTSGQAHEFAEVRGDEWMMRARVIRWKPWATVLGLNAQYRLDSLDGTWSDQETRRTTLPTVADLRPVPSTGIDFLPLAETVSKYAPILEAGPTAGEAAYWPIANDARYYVYLTAQGDLRVETANNAAVDAVNEWMARGPNPRPQPAQTTP